jgi:flagellar hook-associated protein 3 FlgL|tara:strand:- start:561 stop:1484 length:924 start_codon:yes stop_codon:yes gene_type:complete
MKISTAQMFDSSVAQMNQQQSKIAEIRARLATGTQIVKPSDDAEKAGIIQRVTSALNRQDVFESGLNRAQSRLVSEESALMSSENILQRVRELAVRAGNGTLSAADRTVIAKEVSSLRDELFGLANSQDANGNYVFSGTSVKTGAFAADANGLVTYQGDKNQISVDLSEYRALAINRPGDDVFTSVVRTEEGADPAAIGFFSVISDFADALNADNGANISRGLTEISTLTENIGLALADVGNRMNTVDSQRDVLADSKLRYQELLSNAEDLDYATAVTQLSAELLALESAQASFAKISQLNLFNYLR